MIKLDLSRFFLCVLGVGGCAAESVDDGALVRLPQKTAEVVEELRDLGEPIVNAIALGDPSSCDSELHKAMFLADHLPDVADREEISLEDRQTISAEAKKLYQLLTAIHDGAHGPAGDAPGDEEFADRFDRSLNHIADALKVDSD